MSDIPAEINAIWEKFLILNTIDPPIKAMLDKARPLSLENNCFTVEIDKFSKDFLEKPELSEKLNTMMKLASEQNQIKICFTEKSRTNLTDTELTEKDKRELPPSSKTSAPQEMQTPQISETKVQGKEITSQDYAQANLRENLTFENFVKGENNQLAAASAEGAALQPGVVCNPLFFYSGVGLGKTHLMNAIGCYILKNFPHLKVLYISAEEFTNEFIESVKNNKMTQFRDKYRNIDVLLIDDIQFLISKEGTQDEFFYTFESLYTNRKQIVVSSDRPPKLIPTLTNRLRTRFEMGMQADIKPPNLETRIAILCKKAQSMNVEIPQNVLSFIAENFQSNVRELEGALTRFIVYCGVKNCPHTLENASEALRDLLDDDETKSITVDIIIKTACEYFKISDEEMRGKKRDSRIVQPRQIAMYLCKELTGASYPEIGQKFGGKDHSTVIHSYDKVEERLNDNDPYFKTSITNIRDKLIKGKFKQSV